MSKKILSGIVGLLGAISLFSSESSAEIKIAVVGPMTGQYATFGQQMKTGADMAIKIINARGGVLGEKIELVVGDDACDPKQAVAVANRLVNQGVKFVAGHFCSGSSIPASSVYEENDIVQISPASTNPKLTENGKVNVFRVCGRDDQQGVTAATYIASNYGGKNIAILDDKSAYGRGLAQEVKKNLNLAGIREVLYETYNAGEKDYSALVSKMKRSKIDIFYIGGYHTEAGLIRRQATEAGLNAVLMSGDALVTEEYWDITGDSGEGTLMTFSPDPRKNPEAQEYMEEFRKVNQNTEGYVLYTVAAIQVWKQAVEQANTTKFDKLVNSLHSHEFSSVLGKLRFDSKGDVSLPGYIVYKWSAGKYDYVN